MTQLTGSQRIGRNTGLQIAAAIVGMVAIAAVGVSFGRWVVPANDSGGSVAVSNEASISPASVIAEKHYALRGATGEFDAVNVAPVIVGESPASAIAQRHYQQRGQFGELDGIGAVIAPQYSSPAAEIAQRHYEQRGATGEFDGAGTVTVDSQSPASQIVQRHYEQRGATGEFDEAR